MLPALKLKKLVQGTEDHVLLRRDLVASLLAHMFLCTPSKGTCNSELDVNRSQAMPGITFDILLNSSSQEVAKLRMFVQYFDHIQQEMPEKKEDGGKKKRGTRGEGDVGKRERLPGPKGELRIYRQVRAKLPNADREQAWADSSMPLLGIDMVDMGIGFEDMSRSQGCLLADFANMFLGGGVLSGGCVQEEIRFSICPELCVAMLICPCMLENEAIHIVGAEQFSMYTGYARGLRYGGPCKQQCPTDQDGTPLIAITAMDALDLRFGDTSLSMQMSLDAELRELEKAAVAFAPVSEMALKTWPIVATGNWGCGVFGGNTLLKAVLQWLAASEGGLKMRYFPFDQHIGPQINKLSAKLCKAKVTVGQLFTALRSIAPQSDDEFIPLLTNSVLRGLDHQ
jgi:poly(ADP-ribose) glycohydrolase